MLHPRLGAEVLDWVNTALGAGATVRSAVALPGATSTLVLALEVDRRGRRSDLVLRLFDNPGWLADEPDLAAHEAAALTRAADSGLPTPALIAVDEHGGACGVPAVLMTRLPGRVELPPTVTDRWLERLADALATIHATSTAGLFWRYASWVDEGSLVPPAWSRHPALWERAIERWRQGAPEEPERFLHRDYHPVNVLWRRGRISGVVDWVNACRGPASVDMSHCRSNLMLMYGPAVADRFLDAYRTRVGAFTYHPYWDLEAALDVLPDPEPYRPWAEFGLGGLRVEQLRARTDAFLERAVARL